MKGFIALAYVKGHAKGGFGDMVASCTTRDEAKAAVEEKALSFGYWGEADGEVAQVDGNEIMVISLFHCTLRGDLYGAEIISKDWTDA